MGHCLGGEIKKKCWLSLPEEHSTEKTLYKTEIQMGYSKLFSEECGVYFFLHLPCGINKTYVAL